MLGLGSARIRMRKRKTETGWIITNSDGVVGMSDGDGCRKIRVYATRRRAIISDATGGGWDAAWWRGIKRGGFRAVRVKITVTEI